MTVAAIIPAAGSGTRMKLDQPKQYHELHGAPILIHTVRAFYDHPEVDQIVVCVPGDWIETTSRLFYDHGLSSDKLQVTEGGARRQDSVKAGLYRLDENTEVVLVHDGARPLVSHRVISNCIEGAQSCGAAIAAVPVKDTLKLGGSDNRVEQTISRDHMWQAHTPQAAQYGLLKAAFEEFGERDVTDESMLLELAGVPVALVESEETNLKITRPDDLELADKIMTTNTTPQIKIGHGFDAHRLVEDRKLVLGGVTIPYELGLAGHSDADVVNHALCDGLLGALGKGDIGSHFPDSDAAYKDIYSITLLEKVMESMQQQRYRVSNIDITIVCQKPKLAPHLPAMKTVLAKTCRVDEGDINIKATTTEKMGYTGRGEGISCHAVVLINTI